MAAPKEQPTFRARLDRLTKIVEELERGEDLDLEIALKRFEEGRLLHGELSKELARYERRLEVLVKGEDGAPDALLPLEPGEKA